MKRFIVIVAVLGLLLASCAPQESSAELSSGIEYLRTQTKMEKCTALREALMLKEEDFETMMGCPVSYIVIESLPDSSVGTLTLKGEPVIKGQTVAKSSLSYLRFTPVGEEGDVAVLSFRCRDGGWSGNELSCEITLRKNANNAPSATDSAISAISGVPVYSAVKCLDADGDELTVKVESYAAHGAVEMNSNGEFCYTAAPGYSGFDSFICSVTDRFGATCGSVTVSANVEANPQNIVFSDMEGRNTQHDAVKLCIDGVMDYTSADGKFSFSPDKAVNRIDFLVMLMSCCAAGSEVYPVTDTVFADDAGLSAGRKAYLAKAVELGIADSTDTSFRPFDSVTKAEACVWLSRALNLPGSEAGFAFADSGEVPEWAKTAVVSALSAGIVSAERGYFSPNNSLTRERAATILCAATEYMAENDLD